MQSFQLHTCISRKDWMNSDNLRSVDQTVNCVFQDVFSWATGETVHRYDRHCKRHYFTEEIEPMLTSGKHIFRCWSKQLPLEELFLLTLRPQPVVVEGKGRKQELTSVCCTTLWESCNVLFFFPPLYKKSAPLSNEVLQLQHCLPFCSKAE